MSFQQALLEELLLNLLDLNSLHLAAVGRELTGCLFAESNESIFRSCDEQRGKELLFEDGEGAIQVFEVQG